MPYIVFLVLLLIAGLVAYGLGKALVIGVTAFVVAVIVPCAIIGLRKGARIEREAREKANAKPPEPAVDVTNVVLIPVEVFARWQLPALGGFWVLGSAPPLECHSFTLVHELSSLPPRGQFHIRCR